MGRKTHNLISESNNNSAILSSASSVSKIQMTETQKVLTNYHIGPHTPRCSDSPMAFMHSFTVFQYEPKTVTFYVLHYVTIPLSFQTLSKKNYFLISDGIW